MKIVSKHPLLVGTVFLTFASAGLYGCKDFLTRNETPQGTLDATTLANQAGVEGSLIAAYRALLGDAAAQVLLLISREGDRRDFRIARAAE